MRTIIRCRFALALVLLLAMGTAAWCSTATGPAKNPQDGGKGGRMSKLLHANAWRIISTNYGEFVYPASSQSGGTWNGAGYSYIYGGGLWFGAKDAGGTPHVSYGYDPNSGSSILGPCNPFPPFSYNYVTDPQAKFFLSTVASDLAAWPIKDAQGSPIIQSIEDGFATYSDQNPTFMISGNVPIGIAIRQWSYAWNYADNNDIVFFYFKIYNNSGRALSNCYVGPAFDCDVGYESGTLANDRTDFDYNKNMAIQYQTAAEPGYPRIGVVGARYFESPRNNTGHIVHVADVATGTLPTYSHDIQPGDPLGMTAFKIFTIEIDPSNAVERFKNLQGITHTTDYLDAYDEWGSTTPGDKRFLMSSGPFNMAVGESTTTCMGVMAAWDVPTIYKVSDVAQEIYNNHFQLAVPPVSPELTLTPSDKQIRLSWTVKSDTTSDSYWAKIDSTKRWYTYFTGTYRKNGQLQVDTSLIDSFNIKTGPATTVSIKRDAPNPAGGTDTLQVFYNQRAMYTQYDFQGYRVYRAKTQADLGDAAKRQPLGGSVTNATTGASGYFIDRHDGVQIVRDLLLNIVTYPDGTVDTLPIFDTIGTDRGLFYSLVDSNVINNFGWWYGVSAYDYQRNVYFTRKCPTTLASNPSSGSACKFGAAQAPSADYQPATVTTSGNVGMDASTSLDGNGTVNYQYDLQVLNPLLVAGSKHTIRWTGPFRTLTASTERVPYYRGWIYNAADALVDSFTIFAKCDTVLDAAGNAGKARIYSGAPYDQLLFDGVGFRPFVSWTTNRCRVDSLAIIESPTGSRTYPKDSTSVIADTSTLLIGTVAAWQWQGANYEIRWKDSVGTVGTNPSGNILTCTVWDITHNLQVPWEGVAKASMTQASWAFDPRTASYNRNCLDSLTAGAANQAGWGIYISGATVYFRNKIRRILWSQRPETGDVWRVYCSGPRPPVTGNSMVFTTTVAGQAPGLSSTMLDRVLVVPNPYLARADWDVTMDYPNVYFTNLPAKCTIRIYTMSGDLVRVLNHETSYNVNNSAEKWNLLTTYNKRIASGMYIYHVDAPGIGTKIGKFAVIK